jgi:hypothetical protein
MPAKAGANGNDREPDATAAMWAALGAEVVGAFMLVLFSAGAAVTFKHPIGGPHSSPPLGALPVLLASGFTE